VGLWARRRPYVAALIACFTVVSALGLGTLVWQWRAAEAARRNMEVALYESRVALADRELTAGEPGHALELLADCPPALRGWEWFHLRHRRRFHEAKLDPSDISVVATAFHPAGKILATGQGQEAIAIWEVGDGGLQLSRTFAAHQCDATSLAFSRDGGMMVSTSFDGSAKIWDTATWEVRHALEGKPLGGLWAGAVHPDGRRIALAGFHKVVGLWDPESGQLRMFHGHDDRVTGVAIHPDGRLLASSSDDATVRVWDVESGREIHSYRNTGLYPYDSVAFSPDGHFLVAGDYGGALTLWETASGRQVFHRGHHSAVIRRLAFSPDGRRIATVGGFDRGVVIWDAATGQDVLSLYGHASEVWDVAFRADGQQLASVALGSLRVWDAFRREDTLDPEELVLRGHTEHVDALAFSPDSQRIATASWDRTVRLWDPSSGRLIQTLDGPAGASSCVAFGPAGRLAASGRDRTITIWDANGALIHRLPGHQRSVFALVFSHDGRYLASAGEDCKVMVHEAASGRLIAEKGMEFDKFVYALAFSPDDTRLAIAIGEGTVVLRDIVSGRTEHVLKLSHTAAQRVMGLAYSPDGRSLAFGTQSDGIQVWDPATGRRIREIKNHDEEIFAVAYSPDGRYLASGGRDRQVRIWSTIDGSELHAFGDAIGPILGVKFSPDGRYLAATDGDKSVRIWDLARHPLSAPAQGTKSAR